MSESIFSASPRVIRPRLTASSTTSCSRSRLRVTLRSRLARKSSMLLSRPVARSLDEAFAFGLAFARDFALAAFAFFEVGFLEVVFFDAALLLLLAAFFAGLAFLLADFRFFAY